jgi:hypothetical protein
MTLSRNECVLQRACVYSMQALNWSTWLKPPSFILYVQKYWVLCKSTWVQGGKCNRMSVETVLAKIALWRPSFSCLGPSQCPGFVFPSCCFCLLPPTSPCACCDSMALRSWDFFVTQSTTPYRPRPEFLSLLAGLGVDAPAALFVSRRSGLNQLDIPLSCFQVSFLVVAFKLQV